MSPNDVTVVEFDFDNRQQRSIPTEEAAAACQRGLSVWVDVLLADEGQAKSVMQQLGINAVAISEATSPGLVGRHDVYEDCLHVSVAAPHLENGQLEFRHVDILIGERFILTLRRDQVEFLSNTRRRYAMFFQKFAQSMGFLLFEFWDHLIDGYRKVFSMLEEQVEVVQASIFGNTDDAILSRVADITRDLLVLRKNILADREVLHHMAIHKSSFVAESTQPYMMNMVGTLERLGADLAVERDILTDTLTLYLGFVSHHTNRVVNRLTLISVIFLPLTFLCGVYGMNFHYQPEFSWKLGYPLFWLIVAATVAVLVGMMKWKRWL